MRASFDDLVTAATVGLSRRPFAVADLAGPAGDHVGAIDAGQPAAALLDAAALLTVARRAGFRPERGADLSPAAAGETAPELSARAERALRSIGGAQLAPGFAAGDRELLADLLNAASAAGYVASAPVLADLLDAAVRTTALRPPVTAVLGVRGRWLAGHRADWQRVVDAESAAGAAASAPSGDPEIWRSGSRAQRHAYRAARRAADPNAGRELLAADWAQLPGDERAALLAVLARGLSAQDEEFLDVALDDRAAAVRAVARRLLTLLPASRFSQRTTERAATVLGLERHGLSRRLRAALPGDPDAAMLRDGIEARPPSPAIGAGAWRLTQLVAAVPLPGWTALFGLSPGDIVGLAVTAGLGLEVRAGWRLAAVSQGSGEWAECLLAVGDPDDGGNRPPAAWPADHQLAATLAPGRRAARAAALLAGASLNAGPAPVTGAIAEIGHLPAPWPGDLADAVLAVLGRAASLTVLPRLPRGLLDLAARGLPATGGRDYAAELTRLADAQPQNWTPLVRKTAETIMFRRAFLEEIR